MVKADAYNHGITLCKHIENKVDCFGVSTANEGKYLRQIGITKPIKVVAFDKDYIQTAALFDLIPVISDIDSLRALSEYEQDFSIDLKLDCGMNRLGVGSVTDLHQILDILKDNKHIEVKNLFSHFSFTDYKNMSLQNNRFLHLCSIIEKQLGACPKSISASSAIGYNQEFLYNEVRIGLAMYGYMPKGVKNIALKKAMSITTPIIAIKQVEKGEKIGYSGLYSADKNVKIGIIRGGYYDGINRLFSGSKVYINGQESTIIGNVCMDLAFILLENIDAKVNDRVILIGEDNSIENVADYCHTIAYEIMTNFKGRIERVFYL